MKTIPVNLKTGCALAPVLLLSGCLNQPPGAEHDLPNIILCMADDQGWGDMAYNGHPVIKTPNFDNMAESGLRFDRFYAAAPVSSPTRGSVLTGRHPNRFGCFSWGNTLRPQEITLPEALKSKGYATGHFGKWHLGSVRKESPVNPGNSGFDEWFSAPNFFDNDPVLCREGRAVALTGESSMVTVDAALEFIRKHSEKKQAFFVVVWFGSPHNPYKAGENERSLYASSEESFQHYYGEISGMDNALGKLRKELRLLRISDNTILWFCSDNGGVKDFSSTGGRGFKGQIYEGGLRVPSILEWPVKIPAKRVTNIPCCTYDIYPTLLEIAGISVNNQPVIDGISLVPLIEGSMKTRDKALGFWQYTTNGRAVASDKLMKDLLKEQESGIISGDSSLLDLNAGDISIHYENTVFPGHAAWLDWPYKLHRITRNNKETVFELYNLQDDPGETIDLSADLKTRTEPMKKQLEDWLGSVVNSLNGQDYKN